MKSAYSSLFLLLLFAWGLLNLLQANFMDITEDEAYYWMYSRILDWGYFDHPPMIALMIFLGRQLFEGELGVRVLTEIGRAHV